jgi:hypothetical protein
MLKKTKDFVAFVLKAKLAMANARPSPAKTWCHFGKLEIISSGMI